jgi:hypothetical protein
MALLMSDVDDTLLPHKETEEVEKPLESEAKKTEDEKKKKEKKPKR